MFLCMFSEQEKQVCSQAEKFMSALGANKNKKKVYIVIHVVLNAVENKHPTLNKRKLI